MAGAIIIAHRVVTSMGGPAFVYMREKIRENFQDKDSVFLTEIYSPNDEAALDLISVMEQGVDGFNAFAVAAMRAYDKEKNKINVTHKALWDELLLKIKADDRYREPEAK